jgi:hypothetical protein
MAYVNMEVTKSDGRFGMALCDVLLCFNTMEETRIPGQARPEGRTEVIPSITPIQAGDLLQRVDPLLSFANGSELCQEKDIRRISAQTSVLAADSNRNQDDGMV